MNATRREIILALDRAIPPEELERLEPFEDSVVSLQCGEDAQVYELDDPVSRVASYNNTRETEQEIIDWYERAMLLL